MTASVAIPTLAEVIATHRWNRTLADPKRVRCTAPDCGWSADPTLAGKPSTVLLGEHVEQVWAEARTIRTAEEFDALPDGAIVRDPDGGLAWQRIDSFADDDHPDGWLCILGDGDPIEFPALLIHHPDWSQP